MEPIGALARIRQLPLLPLREKVGMRGEAGDGLSCAWMRRRRMRYSPESGNPGKGTSDALRLARELLDKEGKEDAGCDHLHAPAAPGKVRVLSMISRTARSPGATVSGRIYLSKCIENNLSWE